MHNNPAFTQAIIVEGNARTISLGIPPRVQKHAGMRPYCTSSAAVLRYRGTVIRTGVRSGLVNRAD